MGFCKSIGHGQAKECVKIQWKLWKFFNIWSVSWTKKKTNTKNFNLLDCWNKKRRRNLLSFLDFLCFFFSCSLVREIFSLYHESEIRKKLKKSIKFNWRFSFSSFLLLSVSTLLYMFCIFHCFVLQEEYTLLDYKVAWSKVSGGNLNFSNKYLQQK